LRRSVLSAIIGLGLVLGSLSAAGPVPRPSPEFVIQTMSGQKLLSQYRGKVVLLSFILTT
jgi:hypothetical protein